MSIETLREEVVYNAYCDWCIFLDNVIDYGWSLKDLKQAVSECKTMKQLHKLINAFI